jgi:hypothetical protein
MLTKHEEKIELSVGISLKAMSNCIKMASIIRKFEGHMMPGEMNEKIALFLEETAKCIESMTSVTEMLAKDR